ncbi:alpha/beta hydrolase [Clavibacter michiganensis]|nr:alpha/beta fold hydrolase [Clavibacter michiganensis]PPF64481.1 alpha/beta hydrolase [Clavibacter michiganensis]
MTAPDDRRPVPVWAIATIAAGALAAATAAAAAVLTTLVSRSVVVPPKHPSEDATIESVDLEAGTITLRATADTLLPGRYSLWFDRSGGHARIGEIISVADGAVTRSILEVDFGDLEQASTGRISGWFFLHPREFPFPYRNVSIATPVGDAPAWLIPAADPDSTRWVIQVHGRAVRRAETLRASRVFHEAGYTSLLVSYRNDGDAPRSSDGRFRLGETEWEDVDAALAYAVEAGATSVILMGWSMGGATVLQVATRSRLKHVIDGVVLDSPVIDWHETLRYRSTQLGIPAPVQTAALATLTHEWGTVATGLETAVDLDRLDFVARSAELDTRILLLHSDDDGYVSSVSSRKLANLRADIVTFVPFSIARHTKLWNYDPERWNEAIRAWLLEV